MELLLSYFENFNFSHWLLVIFTSFTLITIQAKNIYDGRLNYGVTIFLRLNGKVGKEVAFNFKKEILELVTFFIFLAQVLILFLTWYSLFIWQLLPLIVLFHMFLTFIGNITYRDPIYSYKAKLFEKVRQKDFIFYFIDYISLLFIIYFSVVLFF